RTRRPAGRGGRRGRGGPRLPLARGGLPRLVTWRREPLLAFLLLSLAVFAAYGARGFAPGQARTIVVAASDVADLKARFARTWERPPTEEELDTLIDDHVRTEMLAREAQAL